GYTLFRPRCWTCSACLSLRVVVDNFRPNRSQRRTIQANEGVTELRIGTPKVTAAKLELYDRYHAFQTAFKHWPEHPPPDAAAAAGEYGGWVGHHPFPTEEWCYYIGERLVGAGYVDRLPGALSAIYFFYDPEERARSLGTWNVLCLIREAARRGIPYVYLGY